MSFWYHLDGVECPECGQSLVSFAVYDGKVHVECDQHVGCGAEFGVVGTATSREEAEIQARQYIKDRN